jgi:hypothetical protein
MIKVITQEGDCYTFMGSLYKGSYPLLHHTPKGGNFGSDDVIRRPYTTAIIKYESLLAVEFIGKKGFTYLPGGVVIDIDYFYNAVNPLKKFIPLP